MQLIFVKLTVLVAALAASAWAAPAPGQISKQTLSKKGTDVDHNDHGNYATNPETRRRRAVDSTDVDHNDHGNYETEPERRAVDSTDVDHNDHGNYETEPEA